MPLKIIAGIVFVGACVSLYFAAGWLLIMPRFPGESYFTLERMLYGIGYTILALALIASTGWIWSRSGSSLRLQKVIVNAFRWAVASIALLWIALMVLGGIRQG